jgi:phosphomannomutase/phosphoglucomutase
MDTGNAVQSLAAPYILSKLGCRVITLNGHIDGSFPGRGPEPTVENLESLSNIVRNSGSDIGVAYDGDGDRSIFCDDKGTLYWGDVTGTILVSYIATKYPNMVIITPISTSQLINVIAEKYNLRIIWTKVGSVDVTRTMLRENAIFGFEENGGCLYAPHLPSRDGGMTTALLLEAIANSGETLSYMVKKLPKFYQKKTKISCPPDIREKVMYQIERSVKGKVEKIDGLKLWSDTKSWILIRPSGTEPIIRLFAESDTEDKVDNLINQYINIVRDIVTQ